MPYMAIKLPRRSDRIKQAELEVFIGLSNEKRRAANRTSNLARALMLRLESGARVEPGTHTMEIIRRFTDGKMIVKLDVR